jgi:hypothetical protein
MPLFKRGRKPASITGPDGVEYRAVPQAEADELLIALGTRAGELYGQPLPDYIELAAKTVPVSLLPKGASPTANDIGLMYSSVRLNYVARVAEFERYSKGDYSAELHGALVAAEHGRMAGDDWFATLTTLAMGLAGEAMTDPYRPDVAPMFGPPGIGHQQRRRWRHALVSNLLTDPDSGHPRDPDVITHELLYHLWEFGYWLRACDASLPDDARSYLASP